MTDGFDDRPPDDRTDGGSEEEGDGWATQVDDGADADDEPASGDVDPVRGDVDPAPGDDGDEHDPSLAGVFGARPEDEPPREELVPESPTLENALFLLLGVLLGGFVIYRAVTVFTA